MNPYAGFDEKTLAETVSLTLTKKDVLIVVNALDPWLKTLSRHEADIHDDIVALLDKLPSRKDLEETS